MEKIRLLEEKLEEILNTLEERKTEYEVEQEGAREEGILDEINSDLQKIEKEIAEKQEDQKALKELSKELEENSQKLEKREARRDSLLKDQEQCENELKNETNPQIIEELQNDLEKIKKELRAAKGLVTKSSKLVEQNKNEIAILAKKYEVNNKERDEEKEDKNESNIGPQANSQPENIAPKTEEEELEELRQLSSQIDKLKAKLGSHTYEYKTEDEMEKRLAAIDKILSMDSINDETKDKLAKEKDRIGEIKRYHELIKKHGELIKNRENRKAEQQETAIEKFDADPKTETQEESYIDYRLGHSRLSEKEIEEIKANGGISEAEAAARDGYLEGAEAGAQGQVPYDDGPINGIPGEEKEEPNAIIPQLPRTPEPPTQPIPPVKPKGPKGYLPPVETDKLPVNSGLQQFRKQMNIIRDNYPIEIKHTLTERLPLPQALTTVGGAAIGAFAVGTFPLGLVPVAAGAGIAAVAKPITYRLTGQKQLEENIANQLRSMDESDFDLMVDYLSEEEVLQVKPNAVFLRALNKVMLEQAKDKQVDLTNEKRNLTSIQEQLLAQGSLTPEEERDLKDITERLEKIETEEAPTVARRVKDIKRGKDRVSQRYKGNLLTRFNIFAHRNSTSEEYDEPINEYADAEKKKLEGERDGDIRRRAEGQKEMREALRKHTFVNAFGVQTSQFNDKEGAVKFVSDKRDNTARNVTRFGLMGVGFTKFLSDTFGIMQDHNLNVEEHQRVVDAANSRSSDQLTDVREQVHNMNENLQATPTDTVQQAADAEASRIATAGETGNLHTYRGDFGPAYDAADQAVQDEMSAYVANSKIKSGTYSEELNQLADKMSESAGSDAMHNLQDAAQTSANFVDVDHAAQFAAESGVINNVEAQAEVVRKAAETAKTIEDLDATLQQMDPGTAEQIASELKPLRDSFLGPVIMAVGTAFEGARDAIRNRIEKKQNQALETDNER